MQRVTALASLFLAIIAVSSARPEPRVVIERSRVLSGISTVTQIARQFEAPRFVPTAKCAKDVPPGECFESLDFSHTAETTFKQLYEITILKRTYGVSGDDAPYVTSDTVQRELFATDLGTEAEKALEERLLTYVKRLDPQASAFPFAAQLTGRDPLPYRFLYDESATPTWICVEQGETRRVMFLLPRPEIGGYMVGNGPVKVSEAVCDALRMNVDAAATDRYETAIGVNTLRTFRLTLEEAWDPGSGDARAFHSRPSSYTKRILRPDEESPSTGHSTRGGRSIASVLRPVPSDREPGRRERIYREAIVEPLAIEMPRADSAVWLTRWRAEERELRFGSEATNELVSSWDVLAAWLPLAEPQPPLGNGPRPPLAGWLQPVQRELEVSNEISSQIVVDAFLRALGQATEDCDGLVLLCANQEPRYALTPFHFTREITNAQEVCDAIVALASERLPEP